MTNPLLAPSELPFALPDYANLTDEHVREAALLGMDEQLRELAAVAADTAPATVENVLHAWERTGRTLTRTMAAFWVARAADTTPARDALMAELSPLLAAHSDAVMLDEALFRRLVALRARADAGEVTLDEQDEHLLTRRLQDFRRSGIDLAEDGKERLRSLNAELATLSTAFDTALTAGRNAAAVHVTDEAELDGLADDERATLREAAAARGLDGWLIPVVNTSGQPLLDSLAHRGLRERLYRASVDRGLGVGREGSDGDNGSDTSHDTRDLLVRIARLRAERAELLGYPHHAAYVHEVACAGSTDAVNDILARLTPGVVEITDREAEQLAALLEQIEPGATLEPWDWQYLSTRAASSGGAESFDTDQLKPYLEFERVLHEGVFAAATALYGLTFHERPELVGYTEEARVFEVREEDGSVLGAVAIDPYTRPTKKGGAWMTSIVHQSHLLGEAPLVTNTCNVPPPAPGSPSLMTWDNVITLFHEFGHDLHGLLSDVRYPSRSGTSVPRDFVEFPSQVNEIWAWEPSLLTAYLRHHETGEPAPAGWVEALVASRQESGRDTLELLAAMLLDQAWHQTPLAELPEDGSGVEAFEAAALERAGAAHRLVPPRYRSAYFHHIFGGGYAAGYYSYLWSEVMDADTVAWFREQGDPDNPGGMTRAAGERFRRELLGRGGSIDALETYRRFRGRDPEVGPLLARLGLG
ncbi:M3 family metallopeptidase [Ornithinimicrobium tianjinense]|uniref:Peptidyl-dipeptidase Dcp n=1 Tax=Ornithinimicrobium tianjinense TaxID=1195761 RepID=A0A917BV17_9MICO|nr:M3 family metallopeptidase [Ornithinimicrobium tianjinense]GGF57791.1 peptidyl-dipeptidase Dcp [Ornithinimicrobium tianjinense]